MLLSSASAALAVWFVVRFVLRENLLAYPMAAALALLLGSAASLLQNQRNDLILNGVVEIMAAIALVIWIAYPKYSEPQHV
jgi:predicted histidine transporter YuiF (NhaC family)